MNVRRIFPAALIAILVLSGGAMLLANRRAGHREPIPAPAVKDARALALAPHRGSEPIDAEIIAAQKKAREVSDPRRLEKLGWLYVSKARLSNDPGFYKLAEQCGLAVEAALPNQPDALLLRGHAVEAMHRFRDAEAIARQLVLQREYVLDYALLGDALMEQGRVEEAIDAYQKMADLKPCLQAYTRIAHVRWLKGDLEGAIEVAEEAVNTGNPRDPEPLAWALTKLAGYRFESGDLDRANTALNEALARVPSFAAALLLQGRILLAQNRAGEALPALREAAKRNPLPDYQWTLAEALHAAGQDAEATVVETQLEAHGAREDRRSFALYLATRGVRPEEALQLARQELAERQDVATYDTLAWACFVAGRSEEARIYSQKALAEGTREPRSQLHAGIIASGIGAPDATALLQAAQARRQMLLPTERAALDRALSGLLSKK